MMIIRTNFIVTDLLREFIGNASVYTAITQQSKKLYFLRAEPHRATAVKAWIAQQSVRIT
jgi:hypothetical protein